MRNKTLDIAKGMAMISIILGHLSVWRINCVVFTYHIPIFYLITGYFLFGAEKTSFRRFAGKKARTLLVPYYVACLLIIMFSIPLNMYLGEDVKTQVIRWIKAALYAAGDSYTAPFEIPGIGAIWFLWATFWGSLSMYFLIKKKAGTRVSAVLVLFMVCCWSRRLCWFPLSIQAGGCAALFMYIGWLYHKEENIIKQLLADMSREAKTFLVIAAFWIWYAFIRSFQSFWLVHCDVGRGGSDIFASVCACICIILISGQIDAKFEHLGKGLAYLGRYSLLMLILHIVELDLVPYGRIYGYLTEAGIKLTDQMYLYIRIFIKLSGIIVGTIVLSKVKLVRKVLGYKER